MEAVAVGCLPEESLVRLVAVVVVVLQVLACRAMQQPAPAAVAPVLSPVVLVGLSASLGQESVVSSILQTAHCPALAVVLAWLVELAAEALVLAAVVRVAQLVTRQDSEASAAAVVVGLFRHFLLVGAHSVAVQAAMLLQLVLPVVLAVAVAVRGLRLVAPVVLVP